MANGWNCSRKRSPRFPGGLPLATGWPEGKREPLTGMEAAAKALGLKLQSLTVRVLRILRTHSRERKGTGDPGAHYEHQVHFHQYSATPDCGLRGKEAGFRRFTQGGEFVEAGGLMSYATNLYDLCAARRDVRGQDFERH